MTGSSEQLLLSDCSRKSSLSPSSSSWSIEFLNFLHKSSSSRSNLRTSATQNLQQKTLQLFVAHFLFKHWIASNDFIVWADHTISLFRALLIWAPFSFHPLAANLRWLWSWEATIWWVSECFWGCQRTRRVSWWKKCQAHSSAARQLQGSMNRALQLSCNLMLAAPQQATTGCRNENDELVKRGKTYAGWRGSRVSSKQSPFQFEEECPQFHNCCLLTVQAMQLQSRLQSPKNCSWIKNRLAAVRQPLSRHWYDCEKLPASSVQYYVPLNLPRHGLTQQQSPAAAQATAGPRAAATRAGTTYCSLLSCISVSRLPRRTWRSWRRCVPVPSPSSADDDAPIHTTGASLCCCSRQEIRRETLS